MYDLIVLGGGPAGYNAADYAAKNGMSVLLIEERALGGVCLNEGCIPTKTLLYSAKIYDYAKHSSDYGVSFTGAAIDHAKVIGAQRSRRQDACRWRQRKIKARRSQGCQRSRRGLRGAARTASRSRSEATSIPARSCSSAPARSAAVPPIPGLREGLSTGFVKTNREILDRTTLPKHIVVIGGLA